MDYISHSEAETEALGRRLAAALPSGAVVAYRGSLGMGKTAFTRGLALGLGYEGRVTSPTYRLEGAEDLFDIGWEDYLDRGGVCAVEWSERVEEALPEDAVTVAIARCPENENWRTITVEGVGPV